MCSANGLSEFALNCIRSITRDDLADPVLLIVEQEREVPSSLETKLRKSIRLEGNLWYLQERVFPLSEIPAYKKSALDDCLPGVDRIVCKPELKGKWSQYFRQEDLEKIHSYDLDFILKFAFGIIRGAVLQSARYGVWSFHHDDEERYRGGPPAFWEVYKGDPVTGALLQRLNDRLDGGIVLYKSYVPTDGSSYRANLQRIQECSWHMIRWACLDVCQGRVEAFSAPASKTNAPIFRAPKDLQMLRFWLRLIGDWFQYKIRNQRFEEWNVGMVNHPPQAFLDPAFKPEIQWSDYTEHGQFVADPFPISETDPSRILVEELNYFSERAASVRCAVKGIKPSSLP